MVLSILGNNNAFFKKFRLQAITLLSSILFVVASSNAFSQQGSLADVLRIVGESYALEVRCLLAQEIKERIDELKEKHPSQELPINKYFWEGVSRYADTRQVSGTVINDCKDERVSLIVSSASGLISVVDSQLTSAGQ